jgi:hypothetical protein
MRRYGFGLVDLSKTLWFGSQKSPNFVLKFNDNVAVQQGQTRTFCFSVPAASANRQLRVTLVWMDPPSFPNSPAALVHDLHLAVVDPSSRFYYGNGLRTRTQDHDWHDVLDVVNNVEQVE